MADQVYFDVGGTRFTTRWSTLLKVPGSKLSKLYELYEQQSKTNEKVEYFFDRNPAVFGCILDFHRTGVLHLPDSVCACQIRQELEFWDISPHAVSSCCWKILYRDEGTEKTLRMLDKEIPIFSTGRKFIKKTEKLPSLIWDLMEHPSSSMLAKAYAGFYLIIVVFSIICDTLLRSEEHLDPGQNVTVSDKRHLVASLSTIPCPGLVIEVLTNAVFTVDVVTRLVVSPSKQQFLTGFVNMLDMIGVLGFWILVFEALFEPLISNGSDDIETGVVVVGNILMTLRYVRLYRVAKVNKSIMLVILTLNRSKRIIFLLFAILVINSCVFGGVIYCLEYNNKPFNNAFRAFYWALITMTTVGYGDLTPTNTSGRIVASVCAMTGLFLLAMPIGIISKNYTYLYSKFMYRESHLKEKVVPSKTFTFSELQSAQSTS